jgi:hypothetical protein
MTLNLDGAGQHTVHLKVPRGSWQVIDRTLPTWRKATSKKLRQGVHCTLETHVVSCSHL